MPAILALAIFSGCRVDLVSARAKYPARIVALALCAVALLELSAPMPRVIATKSAPDQHLFEAIKSLPGEPVVELPAGGSSGGISAVFAESKRLLFSIGDWRQRLTERLAGTRQITSAPPTYSTNSQAPKAFKSFVT